MFNLSIRNALSFINVVFFGFFMIFVAYSISSMGKISISYDGLIKGFIQYKALSDTDLVLKEIKFHDNFDVKDITERAELHFAEFMKVAPTQTSVGVQKTKELKNALDMAISSLSNGNVNDTELAHFTRLMNDFNTLIMDYDIKGGGDFIEEFTDRNIFNTLSLSLLFLFLIFASHFIVKKLIISRIYEVNDLSQNIAKGNLTRSVPDTRKDEIGTLYLNIGEVQGFLKEIITEVKGDVQLIYSSASQIADGNKDLSTRTAQQAGSLQETAASMEQIKIMVANNSQNAYSASQLAEEAKVTVAKGIDVMSRAVSAMADVEMYAKKISEISSVINGIANQTNILALNAAVEAARAGEQGRGFAVVASEVRNLATRSGNAAQEIQDLIDQTVISVNQGTENVSHAGNTMDGILSSVSRVNEMMKEITLASDEQDMGVNRIAEEVNQMDAVVQQNASLVEISVESTNNLNDLAKNLSSTMSKFQLEENETVQEPLAARRER